MIKIAHRGNRFGPNKELENTEQYLLESIAAGYQVELDIWLIDDRLYLGHDGPDYETSIAFLNNIAKYSWVHCKNFEALDYFASRNFKFKYFWHQTDDFTLVSNNIIWTYPGKKCGNFSVIVDLDCKDSKEYHDSMYGICSDYVGLMV